MVQDHIDWRAGQIAVFVFHPRRDVLNVMRNVKGVFQSKDVLGAIEAFANLQTTEGNVVGMGLYLLNALNEA